MIHYCEHNLIVFECPKCRPPDPDQEDMFAPPPDVRFDGDDYVDERDRPRLRGQILRIFNLMKDGNWRTLASIEASTGDPPASISAQLRHLRKARFGAHKVEREHNGRGLYSYRLVL